MARPSNQLQRILKFYRDGLGLPVLFSYEHDADYDGVMLGLPGRDYHLEFTQHRGDGSVPTPAPDSLLVFYIPNKVVLDEIVERLCEMGYPIVAPRNPYWAAHGTTIADPDGGHVVLMNTWGFGNDII
jgi:hypothetical protein